LSGEPNPSSTPIEPTPGLWGAFSHPAFAAIWIASTVALTGIAISDTASGWLMTSLNADPTAVSMVQVAANLPMFLFTLPAGALADIFDPRRFLLAIETIITVLIAVFATLVSLRLATPGLLLLNTFLLSAAWSLAAPAWLSITPLLVPRRDLDNATAANNIGYNISRAVGPALGGVAIAGVGIAAPFWIFAACNATAIAALLWWRSPRKGTESLPAERLMSAIRTGVRHAANNRHLGATIMRAMAFFPFASAYWALLPLVARRQIVQGPELYGLLLGAISVGAIAGAFALDGLKRRLGLDRAAAAAALSAASALVLFGLARDPIVALCASLVAGASWIVVLANLYVSAQEALPNWVRVRGLAIFLTAIFGATTVGSAVWGQIAAAAGLPMAYFAAAAGAVLAIPLTWRWKIQTGAGLDLSPSLHRPVPKLAHRVANDKGQVLVTVEYRVNSAGRREFLAAPHELGHERRRDGGYAWGIFEDAADPGRFVETFRIESWLELLHLRERVTNADRLLEDQIRRLLANPPKVTLLIAAECSRSRRVRIAGA
jgi:predicted MFS family arabinose efflux permease